VIPKKVFDEITRWQKEKKYGNIQLNFSKGRIFNINLVESFKVNEATIETTDSSTTVAS